MIKCSADELLCRALSGDRMKNVDTVTRTVSMLNSLTVPTRTEAVSNILLS